MKVCVIFTGGTIGSKISTEGRITPTATPYVLLNRCKEQAPVYKNTVFVTREPYNILSENLQSSHIISLVREVKDVLKKETDLAGIIITHGTDTIQYSAATLSYILGESPVPIALVSSDYVLSDPRANGTENFIHAMDFIKNARGRGVFVVFRNKDGITYVHRGTRMQLPVAYSADMYSILDSWIGRYVDGRYEQGFLEKEDKNAFFSMDEEVVLRENSSAVFRIRPYVGMTYPEIPKETEAVLFESYHSGTIGIDRGLELFTEQARKREIPIFLTGLIAKESEYETVDRYRKLGIKPLTETATVAQYCKLWLACSNGRNIRDLMERRIAGDRIEREDNE